MTDWSLTLVPQSATIRHSVRLSHAGCNRRIDEDMFGSLEQVGFRGLLQATDGGRACITRSLRLSEIEVTDPYGGQNHA